MSELLTKAELAEIEDAFSIARETGRTTYSAKDLGRLLAHIRAQEAQIARQQPVVDKACDLVDDIEILEEWKDWDELKAAVDTYREAE
jgi:hypothetical protein